MPASIFVPFFLVLSILEVKAPRGKLNQTNDVEIYQSAGGRVLRFRSDTGTMFEKIYKELRFVREIEVRDFFRFLESNRVKFGGH